MGLAAIGWSTFVSAVIQTKGSSQWQFSFKKEHSNLKSWFFLDPHLLKPLSFENVYGILPVTAGIAALCPAFGAWGPWFVVSLDQGLLRAKVPVVAAQPWGRRSVVLVGLPREKQRCWLSYDSLSCGRSLETTRVKSVIPSFLWPSWQCSQQQSAAPFVPNENRNTSLRHDAFWQENLRAHRCCYELILKSSL